jgi:putative ATPase
MIFWGASGTGKTTLARLIAKQSNAEFIAISAVLAGVKEIREAIEHAKTIQKFEKRRTILDPGGPRNHGGGQNRWR